VPAYWQQAAADLNAGRPNTRVLFLPGEVQADYRWGLQGPDDLNEALLTRPSVVRSTAPNGSDLQSNFLAALDVPLASGVPSNGAVSAMARYLGAGELLVRNDLTWEHSGGLPPSELAKSLATDPNLRRERGYGQAGENTLAPGIPNQQALPPLQTYAVSGARPIVRAEPVANTLLIDGDSFALPSLASTGMLAEQPAFRLLGSMSPDDAAIALDDGARIVLTDTNRRRAWDLHHVNAGWSPTLPADQSLAGASTLSLFGDPSTQTVTELQGAAAVTATSQGSVFGLVPWGKATAAFDGDPHTAWLTGNFGAAVGQSITLSLTHPVKLDHLTLRPVLGGPVQIAQVRIHLDAGSIDAPVPPLPETTVRFPATTTQSVTVEITGTRGGPGLNPVGFWEIGVPGVKVTEIARLPERLRQLTDGLDAAGRARLDATPLDVVLTRQAGNPATTSDDEERAMNRQFWLPDARGFTVSGTVEAGGDLPDPVVDQLAGYPSSIVATSSSRLFDSIDVRASAALDGNPDTAWIPGGDQGGVGEWIDLRVPAQTVDHVTVIQAVPKKLKGARVAVSAELSLNGGKPIPVQLHEGSVSIPVPRQPITELRLTITKVAGLGSQVRISEIKLGDLQVPAKDDALTTLRGCAEVATVDGKPLMVSVKGTLQQLAKGASLTVAACNGQLLQLQPGEHQLRSSQGWLIDLLHLASKRASGATAGGVDATGVGAAAGSSAPRLTVTSSSATRATITSEPANGPWYLVLGQGYDPRWRASVDGRDLGPPIVLDGYSVGWRITSPGAHQLTVAFGPQRQADVARIASLAALALVVGLLLAGPLRRRFARGAPAQVPLPLPGPNGQTARQPAERPGDRAFSPVWGPSTGPPGERTGETGDAVDERPVGAEPPQPGTGDPPAADAHPSDPEGRA
jgi:arabinofuranan 3-O-arabinosyltransferase